MKRVVEERFSQLHAGSHHPATASTQLMLSLRPRVENLTQCQKSHQSSAHRPPSHTPQNRFWRTFVLHGQRTADLPNIAVRAAEKRMGEDAAV